MYYLLEFCYFKFTLGGLDEAVRIKNLKREKNGLKMIAEKPLEILSKMAPATPPPNPVDLANEIQNAANNTNIKKNKKVRLLIKH